jgi:hypothetical protein
MSKKSDSRMTFEKHTGKGTSSKDNTSMKLDKVLNKKRVKNGMDSMKNSTSVSLKVPLSSHVNKTNLSEKKNSDEVTLHEVQNDNNDHTIAVIITEFLWKVFPGNTIFAKKERNLFKVYIFIILPLSFIDFLFSFFFFFFLFHFFDLFLSFLIIFDFTFYLPFSF